MYPSDQNIAYKMHKVELLNCYKEYISLLEKMELEDIKDLSKLSKLSQAHSSLATCQRMYAQFLSNYFETKNSKQDVCI